MNLEKLQARLKQLETERDNTKALIVMYEGAIQDTNYWIKELDVGTDKSNDDNQHSE